MITNSFPTTWVRVRTCTIWSRQLCYSRPKLYPLKLEVSFYFSVCLFSLCSVYLLLSRFILLVHFLLLSWEASLCFSADLFCWCTFSYFDQKLLPSRFCQLMPFLQIYSRANYVPWIEHHNFNCQRKPEFYRSKTWESLCLWQQWRIWDRVISWQTCMTEYQTVSLLFVTKLQGKKTIEQTDIKVVFYQTLSCFVV